MLARLFIALLLEKRVVLIGEDIGELTVAVLSMEAALDPLAWQVLQRIPDRLIHYRLYIGRLEYETLAWQGFMIPALPPSLLDCEPHAPSLPNSSPPPWTKSLIVSTLRRCVCADPVLAWHSHFASSSEPRLRVAALPSTSHRCIGEHAIEETLMRAAVTSDPWLSPLSHPHCFCRL